MNTGAKDLALIGLFTALISFCSWISVPFTVPFTLQTLGVMLAAGLLGTRRGTLSVLSYIALGAFGLPVFSGFRGGIGVLTGTTGGYIIGFIFMALAIGLITERFGKSSPVLAASIVLGTALCYAFGTAWFYFLYLNTTGPVSIAAVLGWCVFPFIIPDLIKCALAVLLIKRLSQIV